MKIALDFDGTYTEDPEMWAAFVKIAKRHGHIVKIITFRCEDGSRNGDGYRDNTDIHAAARDLDIEARFSNGRPKKEVWDADVWIDDMPMLVHQDYATAFAHELDA